MNMKNKLQSLIEYANTITGENDDNITDAIASLSFGYNADGISITTIHSTDIQQDEGGYYYNSYGDAMTNMINNSPKLSEVMF